MLDSESSAKIQGLEKQLEGLRIALRDCNVRLPPDPVNNSHVKCFVSMQFHEKYNPLLEAIRIIFEDRPYGWEIVRADEHHVDTTIFGNVAQLIRNSDCYIIDITNSNPNVMMELGQIFNYPDRTRVLLISDNSSNEEIPSDIKTQLYYTYRNLDSCKRPNVNKISNELREKFKVRHTTLENLRVKLDKDIYLSSKILAMYNKEIDIDLLDKLTRKYKTAGNLVNKNVMDISEELSEKSRANQILQILQFLEEHFNLKRVKS